MTRDVFFFSSDGSTRNSAAEFLAWAVISVLLSRRRRKGTRSRPQSFIKQAKRQVKAAHATLQLCGRDGYDCQKLQPRKPKRAFIKNPTITKTCLEIIYEPKKKTKDKWLNSTREKSLNTVQAKYHHKKVVMETPTFHLLRYY